MSIGFQCPGCQRPYNVDSALAGKRVRCKQCGIETRVPTPSRPPSAPPPPPKAKAKPPPVPVDIYGFDDGRVEPMPAPRAPAAAVMERDQSPANGGFFGSNPKKRRKRRASDDGPWGVPLRWFAFLLYMACVALYIGIITGVVSPSTRSVLDYGRAAATIVMAVSVVGALISLLRGNRGAFRGEGALGQIAWGWAVFWLSLAQLLIWGGASRDQREPVPLAETAKVDISAYEQPIREMIERLCEMADCIDQVQPRGGVEPVERLWSKLREVDLARDRARALPLPTSDQVRQLKTNCEADFRSALLRQRDAASELKKRFPPDSPVVEYFQPIESGMTKFLRKYDDAFSPGSGHDGWYFAVLGEGAGGNGNNRSAPALLAPQMPEIPRAMLEKVSPRLAPRAAPMLPPSTGPRGAGRDILAPGPIQRPDFPLPGGPPGPPGINLPRAGVPGPPPRPNFPMPPRRSFPRPPGIGPPGG